MELSLGIPNQMHLKAITQPWEPGLTGADVVRAARLADELGFHSMSVSEHLLVPHAHHELTGYHWLDVPTAQAFIAGATTRIRLDSRVSVLPLRHPVLTAKALATLDHLSGGRAGISIGVGWLIEEFEIMGVPFHERGKVTDECLEAILTLFHDDDPSFEGHYYSFHDVGFEPKPIQQPHPPIWIGGDHPAALRRAARFGDGWSPWQTRPDELAARIDTIKSHPAWNDRPFGVFYALGALNIGDNHVELDDPEATVGSSAEAIIDSCGRLAELGVTRTSASPGPATDFEEYLDQLRWIAAEIMPHI